MRVEADLLEGEQEQWHDSLKYVLEFRQNISWGVVLFQGALQCMACEEVWTVVGLVGASVDGCPVG